MTQARTNLLELENVETRYGGFSALRGVSLTVRPGTITAILGNNGAGKSTLLRTVLGLVDDQPEKGRITFAGVRIDGMPTEDVVRMGVSLVPEGRELFPELTVEQNLVIGAFARRERRGVADDLNRVWSLFPALVGRRRCLAESLSGGEQQMVALGRALMNRPRLLLLDEPSLGLAPALIETLFATIAAIRQEHVTVLLVEQNARMALSIADDGLVLENGRFVRSGTAEQLLEDEDVRELYLGAGVDTPARGDRYYRRRKRWR